MNWWYGRLVLILFKGHGLWNITLPRPKGYQILSLTALVNRKVQGLNSIQVGLPSTTRTESIHRHHCAAVVRLHHHTTVAAIHPLIPSTD